MLVAKHKPSPLSCSYCDGKKITTEFFENRDSNTGYDFWCKDCVNRFVHDKETLIQYCEQNNRVFNDELWDKCEQLATSDVDKGKMVGLNSENAKNNYILRKSISDYLSQMNMTRWYEYKEFNAQPMSADFDECDVDIMEDASKFEEASYSAFWGGSYTPTELENLNATLEEYEADFDIPDVHTKNMFKKVIKLSYQQDMATQEVLDEPTKENIDKLEKITKMFNSMSDSVKLNLAKRSSNDRGGFTDLGSLIARVESTGALCRKQEFEKDDVDMAIKEFQLGITENLIEEDVDLEIDDRETESDLIGS